jgi:hypothetical protein
LSIRNRHLQIRRDAGFILKKHVVIAVRIKRRIEINEVNGFILDVIPHDLQIIAVIECVHGILDRREHSINGGRMANQWDFAILDLRLEEKEEDPTGTACRMFSTIR